MCIRDRIIIVGLVLLFKHKIAELIVFAIIAVIAVGFVFNPSGTKDTVSVSYTHLNKWRQILGVYTEIDF